MGETCRRQLWSIARKSRTRLVDGTTVSNENGVEACSCRSRHKMYGEKKKGRSDNWIDLLFKHWNRKMETNLSHTCRYWDVENTENDSFTCLFIHENFLYNSTPHVMTSWISSQGAATAKNLSFESTHHGQTVIIAFSIRILTLCLLETIWHCYFSFFLG